MTREKCATQESATAKRRKAQILDAAEDCFRRKGFHCSSMAQIAAVAGMSPGHIYHYFKKKEDIVIAIVARERSGLDVLLREASARSGESSIVEALAQQAAKFASLHKELSRASLAMEILAEAARNPAIAAEVRRDDEALRQAFLSALGDASRRSQARQEMVAALMEGFSARALRNPELDEVLDMDLLRDVVRYMMTV